MKSKTLCTIGYCSKNQASYNPKTDVAKCRIQQGLCPVCCTRLVKQAYKSVDTFREYDTARKLLREAEEKGWIDLEEHHSDIVAGTRVTILGIPPAPRKRSKK